MLNSYLLRRILRLKPLHNNAMTRGARRPSSKVGRQPDRCASSPDERLFLNPRVLAGALRCDCLGFWWTFAPSRSTASSGALRIPSHDACCSQIPDDNTPPPRESVHLCIRHDHAAQEQVLEFMNSGCVVNSCGGPCRRPSCSG